MKVPSAHIAVVEREKITAYLHNPAHPDNGGKVAFFRSLGFSREEWTALSAAFRKLVETTEVTKSLESPHGWKYILDGRIESPHVYRDGFAFEVEFTTLMGNTAAVVTLEASQVRPVGKREITHARELAIS